MIVAVSEVLQGAAVRTQRPRACGGPKPLSPAPLPPEVGGPPPRAGLAEFIRTVLPSKFCITGARAASVNRWLKAKEASKSEPLEIVGAHQNPLLQGIFCILGVLERHEGVAAVSPRCFVERQLKQRSNLLSDCFIGFAGGFAATQARGR